MILRYHYYYIDEKLRENYYHLCIYRYEEELGEITEENIISDPNMEAKEYHTEYRDNEEPDNIEYVYVTTSQKAVMDCFLLGNMKSEISSGTLIMLKDKIVGLRFWIEKQIFEGYIEFCESAPSNITHI